MNQEKRLPAKIPVIYILIISVVNYLGFLIPSSGGMPVANTNAYNSWIAFMDQHSFIINFLSVITFVIPFILCIVYVPWKGKSPVKYSHFINLPFAFSLIGSLGWILSFLLETVCLFVAKSVYHFEIRSIVFSSFWNIIQEAIFIFTLGFLILDLIHRKLVLPRYFPEGNLRQYPVFIKPSVRFLLVVFYLSIGIFPMEYLLSTMFTLSINNETPIDLKILVVLAFILCFGIIILIIFCDYVDGPLKKLKTGTQKVQEGDYTHHVKIVSNDSFGELADTFNDMTVSLGEKTRKILAIQDSVIKGMAVMVESRDNSTGGHINRTSDCVKVFVDYLVENKAYTNLSPEFCAAIIKAAPMHDLGKIAVDDAVLRKPGKFTDEEYEKMKAHSAEGARIVENVLSEVDDMTFKNIAINVAHYHHEKWNGSGYPEKISGNNIPLEARIMALADVFDALVSKRCYKDSFSYDKAFSIIEESLGSHFDPELGKLFIECRPALQKLYEGYSQN
ncbi:MAG: HD domain-containing protein [Treponema sp.]|nr:HD domain-containing protein [Treponema sp.]